MTRTELIIRLTALTDFMDTEAARVSDAARLAQDRIHAAVIAAVNRFQLSDGRFVVDQDLSARLLRLEERITGILGDIYRPAIGEYLGAFASIQDTNVALQKDYNDLRVDVGKLRPARQTMYRQAKSYLLSGIADAYVQPVKYLLMQQATTGLTIKKSIAVLDKWNDGSLVKEGLLNGEPVPNLQKYAVQIARDSLHQYNGAVNNVIAAEYGLTHFIYVGDIIKDSRPLCKHLVGLQRDISIDEVPQLLLRYPEGTYPDTTKENFLQLRGGYSCRHAAMAVASKE